MTEDELDEAREREGVRMCGGVWVESGDWRQAAALHAARLAREGWEPEDPLIYEARGLCAKAHEDCRDASYMKWAQHCREGLHDDGPEVQATIAALKRGMEMAGGAPQ